MDGGSLSLPDAMRARAAIVRTVRAFFDDRGFVEVDTPVRIAAPAPEPHIDCPPCRDGGYLRASPELQMKRLLAAGMDRIYQIGPCFREGERGSRHSPEFTMLEWYRLGATYRDIAEDLKALMRSLSSVSPVPCASFREISVREAYLRFAGWDPWNGAWDQDRFDFDMATKIEPGLGEMGGGVFLVDYPPQAASLAKVSVGGGTPTLPPVGRGAPRPPTMPPVGRGAPRPPTMPPVGRGAPRPPTMPPVGRGAPRPPTMPPVGRGAPRPPTMPPVGRGAPRPPWSVAERWEFYWNGMELANCFTELCDPDEQRRRFLAAREERRALGEADYPIDEDFLSSLGSIGSAAGVALGVDRLVMSLLGARDISSVRT